MNDSSKDGILAGLERLIGKIEDLLKTGVSRAADSAACAIGECTGRVVAAYRAELHRGIAVLALALAMTFFVCTAATFIAFAALMALWESHRAMAPIAAAGIFALLAGIAGFALNRKTCGVPSRR